jgi:zinc transport system ATP-binding protein
VILSGCLSTRKGRFFYSKEDKEKARRQMRHLELENLASRSFGELSGGQQQRVLIARALCATESLLILDEPVTGLDPTVTRELYEILEKLNKKEHTAIVMVTHDIAGALPYADKVLHIGPQGYFFGTRREYCASEEGKRMLGTAFREEEEK